MKSAFLFRRQEAVAIPIVSLMQRVSILFPLASAFFHELVGGLLFFRLELTVLVEIELLQ